MVDVHLGAELSVGVPLDGREFNLKMNGLGSAVLPNILSGTDLPISSGCTRLEIERDSSSKFGYGFKHVRARRYCRLKLSTLA